MKIVIATGLSPYESGGPATYTRILERELPLRGYEIEVVGFGEVRHLPKIVRHIVYTYRLWKTRKGASVFYALDPVSVGVPVWVASLFSRVPYILRVPGDYAWEQGVQRFKVEMLLDEFVRSYTKCGVGVRVLVWVERFVARGADWVVVPSGYMKEIVEQWGVGSEKIEIIYSVFEPHGLAVSKEEVRNDLGYCGKTIVSAGRLVPWKGFHTLIECVDEVSKRLGEEVCLVILGDGPQMDSLKEIAGENIRLLGHQSHDALLAAVRGADMFVLNTGYEGFSHVLLEAMDLEVPVISTTVGGNPELIENGVEGVLVSYDDKEELVGAIIKMFDGGEGTVEAAAKKARSFTIERMSDSLEEILKKYA